MKFNWKKEIRLAQRWLKRNGSTVSSLAASVGVITTGYFGWKAHDDYMMCPIDPTPKEAVKIFWKPVTSATGTIACIWLGHGLDQKQIAAMTAAYVTLRKSYQEYRDEIRATNPNSIRWHERILLVLIGIRSIRMRMNSIGMLSPNATLRQVLSSSKRQSTISISSSSKQES